MKRQKIMASLALFLILSNLISGFFINITYAWYDDSTFDSYQNNCSMVTNGSFEWNLNWWTVSNWATWNSQWTPSWTYYAYTRWSETVYQDINIIAWNDYTLRFYDWFHENRWQYVRVEFMDWSDTVLSTLNHDTTRDVDVETKLSPENILTGTAPIWSVKARITFSPGTADDWWSTAFIKVDGVSFYDNSDSDCPWYIPEKASIWNYVWNDYNRDGVQDAGEDPVSNVSVELFDSTDVSKWTTTTDGSGLYKFENLDPGDYYLKITPPTSYFISIQDQGWDDSLDSDIDSNWKTIITTLDWGEDDMTWDAWIYQERASIWNLVWNDTNANWIQDAWENWIDWVTVKLYKSDDTLIETQTTSSWWLYHFVDKSVWDYYIEFSDLPAWYTVSPKDQWWDDTTDSDVEPSTFITETTTLIDLEDDLSWDMWIYQSASIWDKVWFDINRDGVQDAWENGVEWVWVELFDSNDVLKWTTTTDNTWIYSFVGLIPWDYYVQFSPASKYHLSPKDNWDDTTDSDMDLITKKTIQTNLTAWENDISWDAWIYIPYASIWNYVWNDTNADWIQDWWESGIANVKVNLLSSTWAELATVNTDANWLYLFENLVPWDYSIEVEKPAGYSISPKDNWDDTTDSDIDPVTGKTVITTLDDDEDDMSWDAWIYESASIWDKVWIDTNANWIQDAGETGLEWVTVKLLNSSWAELDTVNTDSNWLYKFEDLVPWGYEIEFVRPTGYEISPKNQGWDDTLDSDTDITSNLKTGITNLGWWENDLSWDLWVYKLASIWDKVWLDKNANWIQDTGENSIENVWVELYKQWVLFLTWTTDSNWEYKFENLIPDNYNIKFIKPTGYEISPKDLGDDATDSDADLISWETIVTTLESDEHDMTWDAWIYELASIWNYVWHDKNANWIQEAGEDPVENVEVKLFKDWVEVATIDTDATWLYKFEDLIPWNYNVKIITPAGYVISVKDAGVNDTLDSDINPANGESDVTELESAENDMTWDAWIYIPASLWNYVWYDFNANGIQEAGENPIENVEVKLFKDWLEIATTDTDSNWLYKFENLVPWNYNVKVIKPNETDWSFSPKDNWDDTLDSDVDKITGETIVTTLESDEDDMSWDAWIYESASIWNYVWLDKNANWIQETWEAGIENITVKLLSSTWAELDTVNTDSNWLYRFEDLVPWDYKIKVLKGGYEISPKDTVDDALDSDINLINGETEITNLVWAEDDMSWDAWLYELASIWNVVWLDKNANWIQEAWENWLEDVEVKLLNQAWTEVATTTTDSNWMYKFENLIPADYAIQVIKPTWYEISFKDVWDNNTDSDIDLITGKTEHTNLESWEYDPTWDAWLYELASIWDKVFLDLNANWIQDTWEEGISWVTIKLLDQSSTTLQTTTTNTGWLYKFENLIPDPYKIELVVPTGYEISYQNIWADDTLDSDIENVSKQTIVTELESGEDDMTWDAWIYELASLWDRVWHDKNANWVQDAGENGIENVVVKLLDKDSNVIATTTTNSNWNYDFGDLIPEEYKIQIVVPNNYFLSPKDSISDNDIDSDIDPLTAISEDKTLISDEDYLGLDAGIYMKVKLWDKVWHDKNKDGIQDIDEKPIENAKVVLFNKDWEQIAETTTDENGLYIFEELIPNEYRVSFEAPIVDDIIYNTVSPKNKTSDETKDSNIDIVSKKSDVITLVSGNDDYSIDAWFFEEFLGLWSSSSSKTKKKVIKKEEVKKEETKKPEPKEENIPNLNSFPLAKGQEATKIEKKEKIKEIKKVEPKIEPKKLTPIRDLTPEYISYMNKKRKLEQIIEEEWTIWIGLKYLPKVLPKTWTPISKRIRTIKQKRVETDLPDSNIFRLAWKVVNNIEYWKQVLPEQDRNRDEYIVIPSNWLVIPINHVPSDTTDFTKMVSGTEIHVNDYLKTWVMMYPNSSKNEYGKPGNKVVFGHSSYWKKDDGRYKTHFQKIIEMDNWEEVWVFKKINWEFKRFRYLVEKSYNTPQNDVSVLKSGIGSNLTLFTCTPIGGIKWRWIIKAKYINEEKQSLIEQVTDYGISLKDLRLVNKIVWVLRRLETDTKKRKISTFYTNIERIEKNRISEKMRNFLRYLKIRLLKEFFN